MLGRETAQHGGGDGPPQRTAPNSSQPSATTADAYNDGAAAE